MKNKILYCITCVIFFACKQSNTELSQQQKKNISAQEYWKKNNTIGKYLCDAGHLGFWSNDSAGLPVFHYTGALPAITMKENGTIVNNPVDPWFLIGNYHLTLFTNASGKYLLMSLERSIARLNDDTIANGSGSFSSIELIKDSSTREKHDLLGLSSPHAVSSETEKSFGCGFASYNYQVGGLKVKRTLSSIPSNSIHDGCSAFLLNVEIENDAEKDIEFAYTEGLTASYEFMFKYNYPDLDYRTAYPVSTSVDFMTNLAVADFTPKTNAYYATGGQFDHTIAESYPPQVRLQLLFPGKMNYSVNAVKIDSLKAELSGKISGSIPQKTKIRFCYIIGYLNYANDDYWAASTQRLLKGSRQQLPFRDEWKKVLPDLSAEKNDTLKNEMIWDSYTLLAMTNWNEWYQDLFVPQGNIYEYGLGVAATTSDFLMHTLPLSYTKPDVAKSVIRCVLKQTNFRGEINPSNEGACRIPTTAWRKSHTNLYMFMSLAEYLHATSDASFLTEKIPFWGFPYCGEGTVLDRIERIFIFLRDEIYKGKHGLVRTMLSDWNDCFYFYFEKENFFSMFRNAESASNTAMAVQYLGQLCDELDTLKNDPALSNEKERIGYLVNAMSQYKNELLHALMKAWGDKPFLLRAYMGSGKALGIDTMYLEPQCFALGIKDIPKEKRTILWNEIKKRVWQNEKMGARQGEHPFIPSGGGSAENGGFWYSLNGPMIAGLNEINKEEAWKAFNRITFANHTRHYPDYWVGMWSGPDTYDSSISPGDEGLVRQWGSIFPVYCAHAHAWALWSYYKLKTQNISK